MTSTEEAIATIKTRIETLAVQVDNIDLYIKEKSAKTDELDKTINGNGVSGIKSRVCVTEDMIKSLGDRAKVMEGNWNKAAWTIVGLMISFILVIGGATIQTITK